MVTKVHDRMITGAYVNVLDFGAVGDGTTDDTAAWNRAVAAVTGATSQDDAQTASIYLPPGYTSLTSTTVTVPHGVGVVMEGQMLFAPAGADTALVCGSNAADAGNQVPTRYVIDIRRQTYADWSSESDVGVQFINVARSKIWIKRLQGFTINMLCTGDSTNTPTAPAFAHNTVHLGAMRGAKYYIRLEGLSSVGFCNQNQFFGGQFQNRNTEVPSSTDAYAVHCTTRCNANMFYGSSFELDYTNGPVVMTGTSVFFSTGCFLNHFIGIRHEGTTTLATIAGTCSNNLFEVGYSVGEPTWTDTSDNRSTVVRYQDSGISQQSLGQWNSGQLAAVALSNDATNVRLPGASLWTRAISTEPGLTAVTSTDYVWLPDRIWTQIGRVRGPFWYLDTSIQKRFVIRRDGTGGRMVIQARDVNGDVLNGGADVFSPQPTITWDGGSETYTESSDGTWISRNFAVDTDVAGVYFGFVGGSAALELRSVTIESVDAGSVSVRANRLSSNSGQRICIAEPIRGWFEDGEWIQDATAASSTDPVSFICTTAGYALAAGNEWAITTAYALDDMVWNGTDVYICAVAGTSAGAGGPTGTTSGIVDNTVTWNYVAARATFIAGPQLA